MHLATLRLTVRIRSGFRSQRWTVRQIVTKIHRHFNVSVIEVNGLNSRSETILGIAALGSGRREVREVLDRVADAVAAHPRAEVVALDRTEH